MKIAFFDSGMGGITVLADSFNFFKNQEFIYYADTKNVPYGLKSKKEVKKYVFNAANFLMKKNIDALVVACNTATSIAINDLRKKYEIPIIGMEPAIKPAVERNNKNNKKILVLATELTLKEKKFNDLVSSLNSEDIIEPYPLSKLVDFIEKREISEKKIMGYLKRELKKIKFINYSTVVLGCTHFIFFKKFFRNFFPNNINIIDELIKGCSNG